MSMDQGDALEFFNDVVDDDDPHKVQDPETEYVLTAANGRELTVGLIPCDRKFVIDQLNKLPDELLELLSAEAEQDIEKIEEVDGVEEVEADVEPENAMAGLSGDAIRAFENLCAESMEHADLTQHHFDKMVSKLDLEILFELGARVIEISLEDNARITGFRELE